MKSRKKVGLALGSGGTRGFAHLGVIKALLEHNIPCDYIAGTSAGSIIGGAYAYKKDLNQIEQFLSEIPYIDMLLSFADISFRNGFVKGTRFLNLLKQYFGDARIEDCEIPFKAVAADNKTGDEFVLDKGSLAEALRASSSIPILFSPYTISNDTQLIDGGVIQQVPVHVVKDMGADIVIAVNLAENASTAVSPGNISAIQHYVLLMFKNLSRENVRSADIVISPMFRSTDWINNIKDRTDIILEGYRATQLAIPNIKQLLAD